MVDTLDDIASKQQPTVVGGLRGIEDVVLPEVEREHRLSEQSIHRDATVALVIRQVQVVLCRIVKLMACVRRDDRGIAPGTGLDASGGTLLLSGCYGLAMVPAMLIAGLAVFVIGRWAMLQRISGFTGDTAGALVELAETLVLVVCVILI